MTSTIVAVAIVLVSRRRRHQSPQNNLNGNVEELQAGNSSASGAAASNTLMVGIAGSDAPLGMDSHKQMSWMNRWIFPFDRRQRRDSSATSSRAALSTVSPGTRSKGIGVGSEKSCDRSHPTRVTVVDGSYTVNGRNLWSHPAQPSGSQLRQLAAGSTTTVIDSEAELGRGGLPVSGTDGLQLGPVPDVSASGHVAAANVRVVRLKNKRRTGVRKPRKAAANLKGSFKLAALTSCDGGRGCLSGHDVACNRDACCCNHCVMTASVAAATEA